MSENNITDARPLDCANMAHCLIQAFPEERRTGPRALSEEYHRLLTRGEDAFYKATYHDQLAGFVHLQVRTAKSKMKTPAANEDKLDRVMHRYLGLEEGVEEKYFYVKTIAVAEAFRNKRVGTRLLERASWYFETVALSLPRPIYFVAIGLPKLDRFFYRNWYREQLPEDAHLRFEMGRKRQRATVFYGIIETLFERENEMAMAAARKAKGINGVAAPPEIVAKGPNGVAAPAAAAAAKVPNGITAPVVSAAAQGPNGVTAPAITVSEAEA